MIDINTNYQEVVGGKKEKKTQNLMKPQYVEYHKPEFLGFSMQKLYLPSWQIQGQTTTELHIVNLYRKIIMSLYPMYKLKIKSIESNELDSFLVEQFIETRFKQIPIDQDNLQNEYVIDVTNTIGQELMVTTEHIRCLNGQANGKSAMVTEHLCDSYLLFKLVLRKEKQQPISDDKHRACMFVAYDTKEQIDKEEQQTEKVFSSKRAISEYKLQSFGSFKLQHLKEYPCMTLLTNIISSNQHNINIIYDGESQTIIFNQFPDIVINPIIDEICDYLVEHFQSVTPTKTQNNQSCIILVKRAQTNLTELSIRQKITQTLVVLTDKVKQFEQELIDTFVQ